MVTNENTVEIRRSIRFVQATEDPDTHRSRCTTHSDNIVSREVCGPVDGNDLECEKETVEKLHLESDDEIKGPCDSTNWRACAANIRFILDDYKSLRNRGVSISDEVLGELPGHLPEDQQQQYRRTLEKDGIKLD